MFPSPLPSARHSKSGLTILESLVLLISAILLALVAVPVLLVKLGYKKEEGMPTLKQPAAEQSGEIKAAPIPPVKLPDAPKLPAPAESTSK